MLNTNSTQTQTKRTCRIFAQACLLVPRAIKDINQIKILSFISQNDFQTNREPSENHHDWPVPV